MDVFLAGRKLHYGLLCNAELLIAQNSQQDPEFVLAMARLGGMLETITAPALLGSQAECLAQQPTRGDLFLSLLLEHRQRCHGPSGIMQQWQY